MTLAFWGDSTQSVNEWDQLVLGDDVWPGIVTISGEGVSRQIDVKKSKGSDQATLKDEGYRNGRLTASLMLWTEEQWAEVQRLLPNIHPRRKGGERSPLQLLHPAANLLGIDSVYITELPIFELDKSTGIGSITVSMIEYVEKPKPKKPRGGYKGGGAPNDLLGRLIKASDPNFHEGGDFFIEPGTGSADAGIGNSDELTFGD